MGRNAMYTTMFSEVYEDLSDEPLGFYYLTMRAISIYIHHGSPYLEVTVLRCYVSTVALNGQTALQSAFRHCFCCEYNTDTMMNKNNNILNNILVY